MSAGKVTSSVLTVLWFGTKTALFCEGGKGSDKRLMIANFAIFPTLAAKFLPLKMLTVLSFLIFPYFYPFSGALKDIGARGCAGCIQITRLGQT